MIATKNWLLSCICIVFLSHISMAQIDKNNTTPKGTEGTSSEQLDRLIKVIPGIGTSAKEMLIEQSLKPLMMPPRKIGTQGTPLAYAISAAFEFYINLNNNYKDNISPDYLRLSFNAPPTADQLLQFITENGAVSAAIVPYDASVLPTSVYSAQKYKIKSFVKLFQPTTRAQQKIYELKKAIMRGNPVIVEMNITKNFEDLKSVRMWDLSQDRQVTKTHQAIVVGYDEERKAVEIMNCWGRDWGNGGYIWVGYDDFAQMATDAFVIIPN